MSPTGPAVLLYRGKGVVSTLIRWQTRSSYSHAAFLLEDGRILESREGKGVRYTSLADYTLVDVFAVPGMTPEQWAQAIAFASAEVGKGYDWWAIVRFVSRNRMPDNDRWFCSELVFAALKHAGVELLARVEPWAVSPAMLSLSTKLIQSFHVGRT